MFTISHHPFFLPTFAPPPQDDFEGQFTLDLSHIPVGEIKEIWCELEGRGKREAITGAIQVSIYKVANDSLSGGSSGRGGDVNVTSYATAGEEYVGESVKVKKVDFSKLRPEQRFGYTMMHSALHSLLHDSDTDWAQFVAVNICLNHIGLFGEQIHHLHHAVLKVFFFFVVALLCSSPGFFSLLL